MVKCIGVLTSGGDAPGMNAAVRAVARTCLNKGIEVYGVKLGYKGLHDGEFIKFDRHSTRNIINIGGTMLKSARFPEFKDPEVRKEAIDKNFHQVFWKKDLSKTDNIFIAFDSKRYILGLSGCLNSLKKTMDENLESMIKQIKLMKDGKHVDKKDCNYSMWGKK